MRTAASHLVKFNVADPSANPSSKDVKDYRDRIAAAVQASGRARNIALHIPVVESLVDEANRFCLKFGFNTRFSVPKDWALVKEIAKASMAKEAKRKAAECLKNERLAKKTIREWQDGHMVHIPGGIEKVFLRKDPINADTLETSKGARVPLSEAHLTLKFILKMREKGWHRNGDSHKVGPYQLDAVNESGIVVGCHRILWEEIERFYKVQGWIEP